MIYCKSWFRAKKRPTQIWPEDRAEAAHCTGMLYTALVGPAEKPSCFLEIKKGFVGVGFLDEKLREYLSYSFTETEPGILFLSMATHRDFEGDNDSVLSGTTYIFNPSGSVNICKQHFKPHSAEVATTTTDVAANYSKWPEFGDYDELTRIERG